MQDIKIAAWTIGMLASAVGMGMCIDGASRGTPGWAIGEIVCTILLMWLMMNAPVGY